MKAVYPGTFDPVTFGHLDVIKRGRKIFPHLIVAVAKNPLKKPLFSVRERVEMLSENVKGMDGVEVKQFDSLLVEFAQKEGAFVILRGLRETSDFAGEFQRAIANRSLDGKIETVFVMPNADYFYITSSLVKEIARYRGKISAFVPQNVESRLVEKLAEK